VKLSKSATKSLEMLREAFGEHSFSWTAVFEWHSHFKAGRMSVEDDKPKLSKLSVHFFFDLVRELSDTPLVPLMSFNWQI
jgi:hypothetical protein